MKLQLNPTVIYRIPRFSYQRNIWQCWDALKVSIADSSEAFYQQVKDLKADELDLQTERVRFTLWKYFNRAQYRCVPYGTFASLGVCKADTFSGQPLVIQADQEVHEYVDWGTAGIGEDEGHITLSDQTVLFSNSSWYFTTSGIRYLGRDKDGYTLLDNVQDELVLEILEACKTPLPFYTLYSTMKETISREELEGLLAEMITLKMLMTGANRNIIGRDYWRRTGEQPVEAKLKYQIALQPRISGGVDSALFRHVPELAEKLRHIVAERKNEALDKFRDVFLKRFEGREIPLMQALDPEMGLGYAGLESSVQAQDLIAGLAARPARTNNSNDTENFFKAGLTGKAVGAIRLEDLPAAALDKAAQPLPNTTTVLCSAADDLLILDMFGGVTASAILGRFTPASKEMQAHCVAMAEVEAAANPDVLFFDIAYQVGNRIDNVNRREQIYPYSLSILNYDTSKEPLAINDIWVSVSGGQVLLRSMKYGKRLIPRMASAYNYSKSDLSLFRFLCDLQHQGIQAYLQLNLAAIFPGFSYYPRVQYKNIVVSTAKWNLEGKMFFKGKGKDVVYCRQQLFEAGVSPYFKCGFSDQTLTFCVDKDEDLLAFMNHIEKLDVVELEEAILGQQALVKDEKGRPYYSQFALSYTHNEHIYRGFADGHKLGKVSVKPPGSEWLYYEIFCHQQRTDELLCSYIQEFIAAQKEKIRKWFFVRYQENGPHLRIRFELYDVNDMAALMAAFARLMQPELESGIVSDMLIRSYKRELHRYGADIMEDVETHFFTDSLYVAALLGGDFEDEQRYRLCTDLIGYLGGQGLFVAEEFGGLLEKISDSFNVEHHLQAADFKRMNQAHKGYLQSQEPVLSGEQQEMQSHFWQSFLALLQATDDLQRQRQLFADLLHMHINRLFSDHQRTHEMMIYYFSVKEYQRKAARQKQIMTNF